MNEIARHLTSLIDLFRIHLMLCCVPLYKYFASTSCMQIDGTCVVTECTSTLFLSRSRYWTTFTVAYASLFVAFVANFGTVTTLNFVVHQNPILHTTDCLNF